MNTNFSNPLFPDDRCYVEEYNSFIFTQQVEWINFNRRQLSLKNDKLNKVSQIGNTTDCQFINLMNRT